jgi:glycosyltransferase involved in cell wall biosynthesis
LGANCASMVPPGDADALANMMAKAINDKDWLASCLPEHTKFTEDFSVKNMAENLMTLYREKHAQT